MNFSRIGINLGYKLNAPGALFVAIARPNLAWCFASFGRLLQKVAAKPLKFAAILVTKRS